jgi:hypothetical protein
MVWAHSPGPFAKRGTHLPKGARAAQAVWLLVTRCRLVAAAVADGEVVALGCGKEVVGEAEAVGEGGGGEEGVFAFAEVGVVEIDGEGEEVDGEGVGVGGLEVAGALFFGVAQGLGKVLGEGVGGVKGGHWGEGGTALEGFGGELEGAFAGVVAILRGFAADVGEGLGPEQGGEAVGERGFGGGQGVDVLVADVDVELEGEGKTVLHEAGGDEGIGGAVDGQGAMADGTVGEIGGVEAGDFSVAGVGGFAEGERDEDEGVVGEGGGDGEGDGLDDALDGVAGGFKLAVDAVLQGVVGVGEGGGVNGVCGGEQIALCGCGHKPLFYGRAVCGAEGPNRLRGSRSLRDVSLTPTRSDQYPPRSGREPRRRFGSFCYACRPAATG